LHLPSQLSTCVLHEPPLLIEAGEGELPAPLAAERHQAGTCNRIFAPATAHRIERGDLVRPRLALISRGIGRHPGRKKTFVAPPHFVRFEATWFE
jgi:hypothetical protein